MQPSMYSLFAKETFHNIVTLTKNTNNKTVQSNIIIDIPIWYCIHLPPTPPPPPKKKKRTNTSPLFSKHHFPIHQPTHKCLFSLQKEILSHACKPVLGLAFPKWGIPKLWGIHFAMGNFHCEFSKQFKSFFKVSYPFYNGFFPLYRPFCNGFFVNMSFLQWIVLQAQCILSTPFCKGFVGEKLELVQNLFAKETFFNVTGDHLFRNWSMASAKL